VLLAGCGDNGDRPVPLPVDAPPPECATNADCPVNEVCVSGGCGTCTKDEQCTDGVCIDGTCPSADTIIFAAVDGNPTAGCGALAMPCTLERALAEVTASRHLVKLLFSELDFTTADLLVDIDVTIDARDATIRPTGVGPVIAIGAGKTVRLVGGTITGGAAGTGHGIACTSGTLTIEGSDIGGNGGTGVDDRGCTTVVDRAVIHDNTLFGIVKDTGSLALARTIVKSNGAGGLILTSNGTMFAIVGNVFWTNGSIGTNIGGVFLQTDSTTSRLEFNSFNGNLTTGVNGPAIQCTIAGFTARNNVMFENGTGDQVGGTCAHAFSLASPGAVPAGTGNFAADPLFVNAVAGDLHTSRGSPTEGRADPASDLAGTIDLDGESRISPADIGADEHP
jgi:hypothetical protein